MKNIFEQIKNVKMSAQEKTQIKRNLENFIFQNQADATKQPQIISPFSFNLLISHKAWATAFVFLIMVSTTGGVSVVAQNSLPGDKLYSVKINFNEKLAILTSFSRESKAQTKSKQIETRLLEMTQISESVAITETAQTEAKNIFAKKLLDVVSDIDALESAGNIAKAKELRSNIDQSLDQNITTIDKFFPDNTASLSVAFEPTQEDAGVGAVMMMAAIPEEENPSATSMMFSSEPTLDNTESANTRMKSNYSETDALYTEPETPTLTNVLNRIRQESID